MSRKKLFFYLRRKPLLSSVLIFAFALILNTVFVSANSTNYSNHVPAKGSTITVSNPKISTYVKSTYDLDSSSVILKLNNNVVAADFQFKGQWVNDYYEGWIWVITNRKEGTISFNASNLQDGLNTVEVSIKDRGGNTLTDTFSYTVKEPPKFNSLNPTHNSEQISVPKITAVVSDNTNIDWASVKLKVNNSYVTSNFNVDQSTGIVTYTHNFPTGSYTAVLEAKDTSGNLGTKAWNFIADSTAPHLGYLYYFKDGTTITDGKLKFSAQLRDLVDIKNNVSLSLDGVPLNIEFRYEGSTDYYGDYIITSRKTAYVSYEGMVPNGSHTLSLYSEDKLGNKITRDYNFNVSVQPVITNENPLKYGVDNLKPTISAVVKAPNGSINASSISLKLNGTSVPFVYNANTGLLSYTPTEPLKNESYHTVNLDVMNESGLSTSREWKFYTNTYPDMKDSNIESCLACHEAITFAGSNGPFEGVHSRKLNFGGSHSQNNCENCHSYITYPAECGQCHEDVDTGAPYAPHGSTPTIKYQPKNHNRYFPLRVTENREMQDCIVCHQPGTTIKGYEGYWSTPTRTLNNHDIPELHKTTTEGCTKCHAESLTREHAREDRTDKDNNVITCNTCHESTVPEVISAIANKDTSCESCHGEAAHESLHVDDRLSDNCIGCHSNILTTEHKNRGWSCDTCHNSENPVVTTSVNNKNKYCEACHTDPIHQDVHAQCKDCHASKTLILLEKEGTQ